MSETYLQDTFDLLSQVDKSRIFVNNTLKLENKSNLGQFMTPSPIALFMASLFPLPENMQLSLLDPGAGVGSLSSAFVAHFSELYPKINIAVDAYEIDDQMHPYLNNNLSLCENLITGKGGLFSSRIIPEDFILKSSKDIFLANSLWAKDIQKYTHCIMNPPYKKISALSDHRNHLHSIGIDTGNLYTAFITLSLQLLQPNGFLVAIIPRSFCNGPYYRLFRQYLLSHSAIRHIHIFKSRTSAFKDDNVLQENIIVLLENNGIQDKVNITYSSDDKFSDLTKITFPFSEIVRADDSELFIHIPSSELEDIIETSFVLNKRLTDIDIQVSTGPIVDFRLKDHLRDMPEYGSVPLLYPVHFQNNTLMWPNDNQKKPNAIMLNSETQKWFYPNGFYTVVRRFSSKEEKRRIIANVVNPNYFKDIRFLGFENHLNVFHKNKKGLPETVAHGLAVYLNSSIVDDHFRRFSGHTQVNATDLRNMYYPSDEMLQTLGEWAIVQNTITQDDINSRVEKIINE